MRSPSQFIAKRKKLDRLENNVYCDHIFVKQFIYVIIYVTRMGEK